MACSSSALPSCVRDRLECVMENTEILCRQLQATPTQATPISGSVDYHGGLTSAANLVSTGCTKLVLLFSKQPPKPSVCGPVCHMLEQSTLQLVATFHHIHLDQGKTLQLEARAGVLNILTAVKKLVSLFVQEGGSSTGSKLQGSGTVSALCDKMSKLSKDNRMAAGKVCLAQLRLLRDAWEEVRELKSSGGAEEADSMETFEDCDGEEMGEVTAKLERVALEGESLEWSEADMSVVEPSISIVQTTVDFMEFTCKKLVRSGGVASVEELDRVAEGAGLLSPRVDDLVSELPFPVTTCLVSKLATDLGGALRQFIDSVDSCQFAHCHGNGHGNDETRTEHFKERLLSSLSKL